MPMNKWSDSILQCVEGKTKNGRKDGEKAVQLAQNLMTFLGSTLSISLSTEPQCCHKQTNKQKKMTYNHSEQVPFQSLS